MESSGALETWKTEKLIRYWIDQQFSYFWWTQEIEEGEGKAWAPDQYILWRRIGRIDKQPDWISLLV